MHPGPRAHRRHALHRARRPARPRRGASGGARPGPVVFETSLWHGTADRFVVRDAPATRTIGGGVVSIRSPSRYRRSAERLRSLEAIENARRSRPRAAVDMSPHGVDLRRVALGFYFARCEGPVRGFDKLIARGDYDCLTPRSIGRPCWRRRWKHGEVSCRRVGRHGARSREASPPRVPEARLNCRRGRRGRAVRRHRSVRAGRGCTCRSMRCA